MKYLFALVILGALATIVIAVLGASFLVRTEDRARSFTFTPAPYTQVPQSTAVVGITDDGMPYVADRVLVIIDRARVDDVEEWAEGQGFDVDVFPPSDVFPDEAPAIAIIHVPAGAVPAAIEAISKRQGVRSAEYDYLRDLMGGASLPSGAP